MASKPPVKPTRVAKAAMNAVPVAKPAAVKASNKPAIPVTESVEAAASPAVAPSVAPALAKVEAATSRIVEAVAPVVTTIETKLEEPVAPAIEEGKKAMNDTMTKVQETAQKFSADTTERASAMFGDINTRAKGAMEKSAKLFEDAVEFNKGNLEAVVASARLAAKGAEDIAKYSAEYGRTAIEKANGNAKRFAAVKSPTEFFQLQSEVAKTALDEAVAQTSKFSESYLKLLGEIAQPVSNRFAVAVEKVKASVAA